MRLQKNFLNQHFLDARYRIAYITSKMKKKHIFENVKKYQVSSEAKKGANNQSLLFISKWPVLGHGRSGETE